MLIFEENGTCDQPVSTLVSHDEHWAETSLTGLNILLNLLSHSNVLFCGPASVRIHSLLDSRPLNSREEAACFLSNLVKFYLLFSQLNNRLNLILKTLPNLVLVIRKDFDPSVISFFYSFNKIFVKFSHSDISCKCQSHSINGGNRLFEIYPALDSEMCFNYLNQIENIIRPDISSQLQSLVLAATSPQLAQLIFRGEFPSLRICHLG
ncbi:unnamed protein product [Rotaria socialis]|uniref:Uncharacterized protein n=1 Tax=Rotaria socialis TaxID=392032 RepID=A0A818XQJ6_9BILA|nr:unnamed protein product [Rotaria socialis]